MSLATPCACGARRVVARRTAAVDVREKEVLVSPGAGVRPREAETGGARVGGATVSSAHSRVRGVGGGTATSGVVARCQSWQRLRDVVHLR